MSIFDSLVGGDLLKNTRNTKQTREYNKKREEAIQDYINTKEYRKQIRKTMTKEEYYHWLSNDYVRRHRESINKKRVIRYYKVHDEAGWDVNNKLKDFPQLPDNRSVDEIYLEEHIPKLKNKEGRMRFSWWGSRIYGLNRTRLLRFDGCIRVLQNYNFNTLITRQMKMQNKAYEYIKPYMENLTDEYAWIQTENRVTVCPKWYTSPKLLDVVTHTDIPRHQLCEMYMALKKNVYMRSCMYLGNISFLIGEIIVDSYGHIFMPSLEHNIGWLNKDTVDDLYKMRFDWLKCKSDNAPPIVALHNASLVQVPSWKVQMEYGSEFTNWGHYDYYIVCKAQSHKANKQWTLDKILQRQHLFLKQKH